jgi:hypothetical protein
VGDPREFGYRLDGADLIVAVHDRDEHRVVAQGSGEVVRMDGAVRTRHELGDLKAMLAEEMRRLQDRVVFERRDDDVAGVAATRCRDADDRRVIRLGASRGEDDLFGSRGTDRCRDPLAGFFERTGGIAAERVEAVRVTEPLGKERLHRFNHTRVCRCGGGVVQICGVFHQSVLRVVLQVRGARSRRR